MSVPSNNRWQDTVVIEMLTQDNVLAIETKRCFVVTSHEGLMVKSEKTHRFVHRDVIYTRAPQPFLPHRPFSC